MPSSRGGATRFGKERGNRSGNPVIAGNASAEIARIREKMRRSLDKRFRVLEAIADGNPIHKVKIGEHETEATVSASPADRIKAVETLLRYGVGPAPQSVDVTSNGETIGTQVWTFGKQKVAF